MMKNRDSSKVLIGVPPKLNARWNSMKIQRKFSQILDSLKNVLMKAHWNKKIVFFSIHLLYNMTFAYACFLSSLFSYNFVCASNSTSCTSTNIRYTFQNYTIETTRSTSFFLFERNEKMYIFREADIKIYTELGWCWCLLKRWEKFILLFNFSSSSWQFWQFFFTSCTFSFAYWKVAHWYWKKIR